MLSAARRRPNELQIVNRVGHSGPQVSPAPVRVVDPVIEALSSAQSGLRAMPLNHLAR
jgi:hypothetical protein